MKITEEHDIESQNLKEAKAILISLSDKDFGLLLEWMMTEACNFLEPPTSSTH
ncbi:MAG: hypothetical protein WCP96_13625 [Methylococcaceae bacterium]